MDINGPSGGKMTGRDIRDIARCAILKMEIRKFPAEIKALLEEAKKAENATGEKQEEVTEKLISFLNENFDIDIKEMIRQEDNLFIKPKETPFERATRILEEQDRLISNAMKKITEDAETIGKTDSDEIRSERKSDPKIIRAKSGAQMEKEYLLRQGITADEAEAHYNNRIKIAEETWDMNHIPKSLLELLVTAKTSDDEYLLRKPRQSLQVIAYAVQFDKGDDVIYDINARTVRFRVHNAMAKPAPSLKKERDHIVYFLTYGTMRDPETTEIAYSVAKATAGALHGKQTVPSVVGNAVAAQLPGTATIDPNAVQRN